MSDTTREANAPHTGVDEGELDYQRFRAEMDRLEESIQKSLAETRKLKDGAAASHALIEESLARIEAAA